MLCLSLEVNFAESYAEGDAKGMRDRYKIRLERGKMSSEKSKRIQQMSGLSFKQELWLRSLFYVRNFICEIIWTFGRKIDI